MARKVTIRGTNPYTGKEKISQGDCIEDLVREATLLGLERRGATIEDLSVASGVEVRRLKRFLEGGSLSFGLFQTLVTVSGLEPAKYLSLVSNKTIRMVDFKLREIQTVMPEEDLITTVDLALLAKYTGLYPQVMKSTRRLLDALVKAKGIGSVDEAKAEARKMARRIRLGELPSLGDKRLG